MKIFIYGFGPYREYKDNVTETILARVRDKPELEKHVFEVRFDREQFEREFERVKPDIILGLGQHPRARTLRVERLARDIRSDDGKTQVPIEGTGDKKMSLTIPPMDVSRTSQDAGDYVCNYSMWVAQSYAESHNVKAGFLHVPRRVDLCLTIDYLNALVSRFLGEPVDLSIPGEDYSATGLGPWEALLWRRGM